MADEEGNADAFEPEDGQESAEDMSDAQDAEDDFSDLTGDEEVADDSAADAPASDDAALAEDADIENAASDLIDDESLADDLSTPGEVTDAGTSNPVSDTRPTTPAPVAPPQVVAIPTPEPAKPAPASVPTEPVPATPPPPAAAQAQNPAACPQLPADAKLAWEHRGSGSADFCRALRSDGSEAFGVYIAAESPFSPKRVNRDVEGFVDGRKMYWYRAETALKPDVTALETLIQLDDGRVAHIWLQSSSDAQMQEVMGITPNLRFGERSGIAGGQ